MSEPEVGERLDQYELEELVARSGMASIFKARDTVSGETVALKVPHLQLESDVVFFERFRREEEIGQRLDHPNIIRVLSPASKSRMYVAMEFVEGRSLRSLLSQEGPLPLPRALAIVLQVCDALEYLHARGVVHRDLKPENLLLTAGGQVKLVDFGIALDESARRLTWARLSATIGTPDYLAPEQINGRRGDARTDVYGLGTLLYEMLTGELPYSASNAFALMRAKTRTDARPPRHYRPDIDASLETIILRALERSPRDRYDSVAEVRHDLLHPAGVVPRDRTRRRDWSPGAALLRRLAMPLLLLAVLSALGLLIWLSSRPAGQEPRVQPIIERHR